MPSELSRAMEALSDEVGRAIFFVLFKYGEMSISQIMGELQIPIGQSDGFFTLMKTLQKAALVNGKMVKIDNEKKIMYDVTEFGEDFVNNLMTGLEKDV